MSLEQPKDRSPLTARRLLLTPTRFTPDGGLALANFVRSFELNSNITPRRRLEVCSGDPASPFDGKHRNLTTGTFNQVVKDRIAFPPERRVFSPAGSRYESSRPRNLLKYRSGCWPVNCLNSQDFHKMAISSQPSARNPSVQPNSRLPGVLPES